MKKIVVVGGGAAGMMAAARCGRAGCSVTLLEKNEKLGKKLFITGKGRCNLTNACDVSELFSHVVSNKKFLYSAFYSFSNEDTLDFFHSLGLRTKTERGNRVFPCSDKSSDVIRALSGECERLGVKIRLRTPAVGLVIEEGRAVGVRLSDSEVLDADCVILATGGVSYPGTGASDRGLRMAESCGHSIHPLRPGLTGILAEGDIPKKLQGLTIKNCALFICGEGKQKKKWFEGFGEVLFTHYGVSGPLILSASSQIGDRLGEAPMVLHMDLKPGLDREQLDRRILRDFSGFPNLDVKNALVRLLPASMIPVILSVSGIAGNKKVNQVSREERRRLCDRLKDFTLVLTGLRDIEEAIITRGGVSVREVDSSTMESKLVQGLYFAGEMLDVDALTGGFNLQIAWSTGCLAGAGASGDL